ncbi:MAG: Do family serine endopeptidase [Proteobacteria bacterium]|nr:Do family serine endopeptidase [Pseudomonadota bacterium]
MLLLGPATATPATAAPAQLSQAIADVAQRVSPSVVSIRTEQRARNAGHWLFGNDANPWRVRKGNGSGVVVRPDGYILTNHHVVADADEIQVALKDGRELTAEVVGTDPTTDLAVIRVPAAKLPATALADSSKARVGEWVVAIGSPFGLDYTVTAGVLSAVGRGSMGVNKIEDYLQTDASINPGNSGGPLVNLQGEVLGINTMIVGRANVGIGFAVPSNLARQVVKQVIETGEVRRSWIGVGYQELTTELAKAFNVRGGRGVLINYVERGGPADRAKLKQGDVIVSVDGIALNKGKDLPRTILAKEVGSIVKLGIARQGRIVKVSLKTGERPVSDSSRSRRGKGTRQGRAQAFGLRLENLTPQLARRLGHRGKGRVAVVQVAPGSPAARAGLSPRDIILEADGKEVRSSAQVHRALQDGKALLRIARDQGVFYTVLSLSNS